mmetsp:Transcript_13207/g.20738  ORF Transcript_13207/g.20738 Transcript_13207/m.20738 type:complete len:343 (+) Transcript_13207:328-1356(+)
MYAPHHWWEAWPLFHTFPRYHCHNRSFRFPSDNEGCRTHNSHMFRQTRGNRPQTETDRIHKEYTLLQPRQGDNYPPDRNHNSYESARQDTEENYTGDIGDPPLHHIQTTDTRHSHTHDRDCIDHTIPILLADSLGRSNKDLDSEIPRDNIRHADSLHNSLITNTGCIFQKGKSHMSVENSRNYLIRTQSKMSDQFGPDSIPEHSPDRSRVCGHHRKRIYLTHIQDRYPKKHTLLSCTPYQHTIVQSIPRNMSKPNLYQHHIPHRYPTTIYLGCLYHEWSIEANLFPLSYNILRDNPVDKDHNPLSTWTPLCEKTCNRRLHLASDPCHIDVLQQNGVLQARWM